MTTEQIYERVREIVAWHARSQGNEIDPGHVHSGDLLDDYGVDDTLDCVDLTMACEERFNIDMPDDLIASDMTVGDLVQRVAGHLREHAERHDPARDPRNWPENIR